MTCIDFCLLFALDETKTPVLTQHRSVLSGGLADPYKVTYKFLNLPMLFRNYRKCNNDTLFSS